MSTRSNIIVHRRDGKYARVYCHHDGYPSGVGQTLHDHYADQDRAEALVAPGDMSILGERCDKPPGHSYDRPAKGCTVYYHRDRDEPEADTRTQVFDTLAEATKNGGGAYVYLFDEGFWTVHQDGNWRGIPEALAAGAE